MLRFQSKEPDCNSLFYYTRSLNTLTTPPPPHLASNGERVTQLGFPGPEFPEHLRDRPGLDAAVEQLVELLRPGRDLDDLRPLLVELGRGREPHRDELLRLGLRRQSRE